MKKDVMILRIVFLIIGIIGLMSCEKEPWKWDTSRKDEIYMYKDSMPIIFSEYNDSTWTGVRLLSYLVGMPADYDREFKLEVVDSGTNIPTDYFKITSSCLKAGKTECFLEVFAMRPSEEFENGEKHITLKMVENEHFLPVMSKTVYFAIYVRHPSGVPKWWDETIFGKYSEAAYKVYFKFYDKLPLTHPIEWNSTFDRVYGTHMALMVDRWVGVYATFLPKLKEYVLIPMFDYCMQNLNSEIEIPQWYKELER